MKKVTLSLLVCVAAFALQGCLLVPFIDAFKKTGVAESDRQNLLQPEVKKFTEALRWGSKSDALGVVSSDSRATIAKQLKGLGEEEQIFDAIVEDVEWLQDAYVAKVSLKVKFYKVPYYVVKTRIEEQQWEFSVAGGWKLKERNLGEG
jgi:hypothetical protein